MEEDLLLTRSTADNHMPDDLCNHRATAISIALNNQKHAFNFLYAVTGQILRLPGVKSELCRVTGGQGIRKLTTTRQEHHHRVIAS